MTASARVDAASDGSCAEDGEDDPDPLQLFTKKPAQARASCLGRWRRPGLDVQVVLRGQPPRLVLEAGQLELLLTEIDPDSWSASKPTEPEVERYVLLVSGYGPDTTLTLRPSSGHEGSNKTAELRRVEYVEEQNVVVAESAPAAASAAGGEEGEDGEASATTGGARGGAGDRMYKTPWRQTQRERRQRRGSGRGRGRGASRRQESAGGSRGVRPRLGLRRSARDASGGSGGEKPQQAQKGVRVREVVLRPSKDAQAAAALTERPRWSRSRGRSLSPGVKAAPRGRSRSRSVAGAGAKASQADSRSPSGFRNAGDDPELSAGGSRSRSRGASSNGGGGRRPTRRSRGRKGGGKRGSRGPGGGGKGKDPSTGEEITTLFVTGLPDDITEAETQHDVERDGWRLAKVMVMRRGSETNCFLRFESLADAKRAMEDILAGRLRLGNTKVKAELARRNTN